MTEEPYRSRRERNNTIKVADLNVESSSDDPYQIKRKPSKKASSTQKWVRVVIILILLLIGVGIGFWLGQSRGQEQKTQTSHTESKKSDEKDTISQEPSSKEIAKDPELSRFIKPTTGEKWYDTPKKLAGQGLVLADWVSTVDYYEVGTRGDAKIILASLNGGLQPVQELFEQAKDGSVKHISKPSATAAYEDWQNYPTGSFVSKVSEDTSIHYDSLSVPKSLRIDNDENLSSSARFTLGDIISNDTNQGAKTTVVRNFGQNKVLRVERSYVDTGLSAISYVLQTPIKTQQVLRYTPIDLKLNSYTWNNGISVDDTVDGIVRGCGALTGASRADKVANDDFMPTGKTPDGQTVYEFKNSNTSLVQKAYEEYVQFYTDDGQTTILSKEDFLKQHALFAYKNKGGEWLVYTRSALSPGYGCAKPVVYLYPENEQKVEVRVGADVKLSDPLYDPLRGWTAVARPDGQLTVNGQQYDSLFWEGPGFGAYPAITSGTIVKKDKALIVIKKQLAEQGLNQKEIKDFVDYWRDQIPNKPYIRLTWFNTQQLNQLAPLSISPKPDTVQRVFLDMQGYDKPIKLPQQKLKSFERKGFTVVEWGGLSSKKLY